MFDSGHYENTDVLSALGGDDFVQAVKAERLTPRGNSISFLMRGKPANRASGARVSKDALDNFTIEFFKLIKFGRDVKTIDTIAGIPADELQDTFMNAI